MSQDKFPAAFVAAVHAVTAAVNCLECRHAHFLVAKPAAETAATAMATSEPVAAEAVVRQQDPNVDDQHASAEIAVVAR